MLALAPAAAQRATLHGAVFDSISNKPLAGAKVQLVAADTALHGKQFTATADSSGQFTVPDVPFGHYDAGFFHQTLDTLGLEPREFAVTVAQPEQTVVLSTPSGHALLRAMCPSDPTANAAVFGQIHDADTELPLPGASALVSWLTVDRRTKEPAQARLQSGPADESGSFVICGIAADTAVRVRALNKSDSSGTIGVEVPSGSVRHVSMYVGRAATARVTGHVHDAGGHPIAAARVQILGATHDTVTDAAGAFALERVPIGSRSLVVRGVGFAPAELPMQLLSGRTDTVSVTLERVAVLSPVVARAAAEAQRRTDAFATHRRTGGGQFLDPTTGPVLHVDPVAHMMQGLSSVFVDKDGRRGGEWVIKLNTLKGNCSPQLVLNGKPTKLFYDDIVRMIDFDDLVGIEVYTRSSQVPADYNLPAFLDCGVVAFWTRSR